MTIYYNDEVLDIFESKRLRIINKINILFNDVKILKNNKEESIKDSINLIKLRKIDNIYNEIYNILNEY